MWKLLIGIILVIKDNFYERYRKSHPFVSIVIIILINLSFH
jgi:hypothetical protein